ncbi:unnamed protein product [Ilex paraguariensis]|uniref:Uncharacterized protein n=1 Tax=Ilex paraguariensis TaxID=185542 RepID=A0ABC8SV20_9AQUA
MALTNIHGSVLCDLRAIGVGVVICNTLGEFMPCISQKIIGLIEAEQSQALSDCVSTQFAMETGSWDVPLGRRLCNSHSCYPRFWPWLFFFGGNVS